MNHVIVVADTCSQATQERGHEPDALVITALSKYCHDKSMHVVLVGEIAAEVNESRKDLGQEGGSNASSRGFHLAVFRTFNGQGK